MIYILTGPIRSGKTTRLENWVKNQKNIAGILMPVIDGKRYFFNISTGERLPAEAKGDEQEVVSIGPYRFCGKGFSKANRDILESFEKYNILVIDEIGPIELQGKGFASSLNAVLSDQNKLDGINLILVVREGLVKQVTENFKISDAKILTDITDIKL